MSALRLAGAYSVTVVSQLTRVPAMIPRYG